MNRNATPFNVINLCFLFLSHERRKEKKVLEQLYHVVVQVRSANWSRAQTA